LRAVLGSRRRRWSWARELRALEERWGRAEWEKNSEKKGRGRGESASQMRE
jgi:hypothetical protein